MGRALKANGFGRIITIEHDPAVFNKAKQLIDGMGPWIEYRQASSLETKIDEQIDLLYSDSDINIREQEVRRFLPQIRPHGLLLIHDASSHFKVVHEAASFGVGGAAFGRPFVDTARVVHRAKAGGPNLIRMPPTRSSPVSPPA